MRMTFPVLFVVTFVCTLAQAAEEPRIFQSDGKYLAAAKARMDAPDDNLKRALREIREHADKALDFKLVTVTDKPFTPPGGDKHDYMSLSPYWWPDKSKPDGKPFIREDGEINPDRDKYDLPHMESMADAVEALGMGYYFYGDEKYAEKASQLMRAWFFAPETRMNPNCKYAQFIPGVEEED